MDRKESLREVVSLNQALKTLAVSFRVVNKDTVEIEALTLRIIFCDLKLIFYRFSYDATKDFTLVKHGHSVGHEYLGLSGTGNLLVESEGFSKNLLNPGDSAFVEPCKEHTLTFFKDRGPFDGWMVIIPPDSNDLPLCDGKECRSTSCEILNRSFQLG